MKLFIDTNVWLRFFLGDVESQHQECVELFGKIERGNFRPYTSAIVILEIYYLLDKFYAVPTSTLWEFIEAVIETRNITIIDKTDTQSALALSKKSKRKVSDCFIVTQIPKGVTLCTYDDELKKLSNGAVKTPAEIIL